MIKKLICKIYGHTYIEIGKSENSVKTWRTLACKRCGMALELWWPGDKK